MAASVPVLLYHHVCHDREVTPAGFSAQLDFLASRGWRTTTLAELADHLSGRRACPPRSVMLTFDDGYLDNWVHAFPELLRRKMSAVFFVVTDKISDAPEARRPRADEGGALADTLTDERGSGGFMNWAELSEMAASGCAEVGSHTRSHRGFIRGAAWDLPKELEASKRELEMRLGRPCTALAWPWGDEHPAWRATARQAGYSSAFGARPGPNSFPGDPLGIFRTKIRENSLDRLRRKLWLHSGPWISKAYGALHGLGAGLRGKA